MNLKKILIIFAAAAFVYGYYLIGNQYDWFLNPEIQKSKLLLNQLKACENDLETYCKSNPSVDGLNCLMQNVNQLSLECRPMIQEAVNLRELCSEDTKKYCPNTEQEFKKTGVSLKACLKEHIHQISEQCLKIL